MHKPRCLWAFFLAVCLNCACQGLEECSEGREIKVDGTSARHGVITSAGFPRQIIPSNCRYEISTISYFTVYARFTNVSLPDCEQGFLLLERDIPDGDNLQGPRKLCKTLPPSAGSLTTEQCAYCENYNPYETLHSKANTLVIKVNFKEKLVNARGFRLEWRTGAYGSMYNWKTDPAKNMEPDTMNMKLVLYFIGAVLGGVCVIITPYIVYIRWRKTHKEHEPLLDNEETMDGSQQDVLEAGPSGISQTQTV